MTKTRYSHTVYCFMVMVSVFTGARLILEGIL